ncbi:MAG TPA: hypothetical protein P5254_14480 [Aquihabitans sp.]|nr:hypothetical protein [Aquihabitans sp.]
MTDQGSPQDRGLEDIARCTDCPDPEELAHAEADLRTAMARVRAALGTFDAAQHEAWASYAVTIDRALVHLEAELNVSQAQLGVLQAATSDDLKATMARARTSWSAMNDDLRLQAHLAELDARDRVDQAGSTLHQAVESIGQRAAHDLDAVRREAERALGGLRHALGGLRGGVGGDTEG